MPDQTSPVGDDFPCCTTPTPRVELSREHLEVFAVDPHAAAESEVKAMAQELLAARARLVELEGDHARLVEGVASTVRRFSATLDARDALRARVAELEAQREPIGYLIVTEVEGRRVVHGDHRQLMTCAEAIESVGRSDLPRGMRHLLCTVQEAD
ncbi:hypothetical protein [Nocardia farcinica]|uniref:hypothetical protein n=1 Tax=Nocardia farcinica TaxID=37329 RepID=UPI002458E83F|nr:hypothetical protein [Nocardia farcinica]